MSFYEDYFKLILKYANKYKPPKHNTKYSNSYYLTHIFNVLGDAVSWKSLMKFKFISSNSECHYKTINKIHIEWARNGVYESAYNKTLKLNKNCHITPNNYIDGTLIINKSGFSTIKTLSPDSKTIIPSIKYINKTPPYNLVGGAGFISNT